MKCPSCGEELQFMHSLIEHENGWEEEPINDKETYFCAKCEEYWDNYK